MFSKLSGKWLEIGTIKEKCTNSNFVFIIFGNHMLYITRLTREMRLQSFVIIMIMNTIMTMIMIMNTIMTMITIMIMIMTMTMTMIMINIFSAGGGRSGGGVV